MEANTTAEGAVLITKRMLPPRVGSMSLVGINPKDYPVAFGNYCRIATVDGPYLCNMWAENLKEWALRNPEASLIEVTEYSHQGRSIGVVTDERLEEWCSRELCVTGHGWPSEEVKQLVGASLSPITKELKTEKYRL